MFNARAKLYAIVGGVILVTVAAWLLYARGLHTGEARQATHTLDTQRLILEPKIVLAKKEADSADTVVRKAVTKTVTLHNKWRAVRDDSAYTDSLKIALADTVIKQDSVTIGALQLDVQKKDFLLMPLISHDSLATEEIKVLKKEKTPRFGLKTGVAIGVIATSVLVFLLGHAH